MKRRIAILFLIAASARADIIVDVRIAAGNGNLPLADAEINNYRTHRGVTPELLEAMSWKARALLELKQTDQAAAYARETEALLRDSLKGRPIDTDPHLPAALGATIEVQAQALATRGERAAAIAFLRKQLATWGGTSIRSRLQKNINLLTLEGKPAPPLDEREYLGPRPVPLAALRGKVVLLFFWAHWCSDCKGEEPIIAQLRREYAPKGLVLIAPTQRYGYIAGGQDATPQQEMAYIEAVRKQFYSDLLDVPAPVSEANFNRYGASTTPTLVLIDRGGIVRLYHPGAMQASELRSELKRYLGG